MTIEPRHRQILTVSKNLLSEELMADAIVIAITRRKGQTTETFLVSDGNLHTVRGVAQYVYDQFLEDPDFEVDEDDGEIETTEEEGEGGEDGSE
jgi:hypothetical protein